MRQRRRTPTPAPAPGACGRALTLRTLPHHLAAHAPCGFALFIGEHLARSVRGVPGAPPA